MELQHGVSTENQQQYFQSIPSCCDLLIDEFLFIK